MSRLTLRSPLVLVLFFFSFAATLLTLAVSASSGLLGSYQRFYNQAFVVMEYFGYLRRDPDALYLNWIQVLDANPTDSRRMVAGFVDATEYRNRFRQ